MAEDPPCEYLQYASLPRSSHPGQRTQEEYFQQEQYRILSQLIQTLDEFEYLLDHRNLVVQPLSILLEL